MNEKKSGSPMKVGVIGLGGRGKGMMRLLLDMADIEVSAVCDLYEDRTEEGASIVHEKQGTNPFTSQDYREIIANPDVEAVFVFAAWEAHIETAVASMRAGKPVAVEVGGAYSLNDCWKLVNTYEDTKTPVMLLENVCYARNELMILNMIRQGIFGELIHCQGGYRHDLRQEIAFGRENRHYRFRNYLNRNCENYPTHELGPIAQMLDINRGNRMVSLVSVASKARGLHEYIVREKGESYDLADAAFAQGDIVTTVIKCARGETIVLTLDTTLPRAYSRALHIQGTKGLYMEDNQSIFIDGTHNEYHHTWSSQWNNIETFRERYEHPLWKDYQPDELDGHGGIDFLVLRDFIESVKEQKPMPIDVYDMAAWMSVSALSEESIVTGQTVAVPDFTNGKWILC